MIILFVPLRHNGKFHIGAYRWEDKAWWTDSHTFVMNPTHWQPMMELPSIQS